MWSWERSNDKTCVHPGEEKGVSQREDNMSDLPQGKKEFGKCKEMEEDPQGWSVANKGKNQWEQRGGKEGRA